ncbi:MAG: GerMN domain-containing protein [Treponema sp.]|nr:GerMN domain-containing protein [Treponema sp.]MCL2250447.1 GerMN domain-containing protein [Treponema sp.]
MATKKNKNNFRGAQILVVFWIIFIIVIISVYIINKEKIKNNFNIFLTSVTAPAGAEKIVLVDNLSNPAETESSNPAETTTVVIRPAEPSNTERPAAVQPAVTATPTTQPASQPTPATQPQTQPAAPSVQTRDRNIYFTQVNNDGQILQSRVTRRIPLSDTPMQDVLNSLLRGPSADEINRGIINIIPQNTRVLSTTVRGTTAYISFSEDFLFNTFGVEGYIAQLRQIVWTVTEFSNVRDVQVLVDGNRLDYLGDGVWIGSPISRQSF